ncbi:MAG: DUF3846 domain-containing protein [Oscillospiraceae bacterium]|nr:DUF3846 domain-containing protein [Oscillospiraceae bacterium]
MNVLVVEPGYLPYEKEILDSADHLEQMQAIVGGLIEPIYPYHEEVAIVCNEEGLINGLPFNRSVPGGYGGVFGTFFICGLGEEDFCSLPPELMERFKKEFRNSEILLGFDGNEAVTLKVSSQPKPHDTPLHEKNHGSPER